MNLDDADRLLARQAADGNQRAFGQLVERHGIALAQAARSFGVPETDIDDVVQDTFVAAWHALDDFDPDRPFRAWLFRIGLNKMRDLYRFRRVRQFLFGAEDLGEMELAGGVANEEPGPEQRVAARRDLARVIRTLDKLDRSSREAIVLTAIVGMSQPEAAAVLGMSAKAVEGRIARARAKLAAVLETVLEK
ncbi:MULTISPECIES: RNA polymerase sigma factor [Cupriavidus]|uniref:RNA polymerase sigma factor n=1 Tax=Cupriavidus campinensis TaxID=151783 RepID=A0ABY3EUH7_9BURK|nr:MULTISPECIES: RNA polymerase sigma factor [Cupriavidus]TSP14635.1 RNA polymerase sigma factor [Cupriavidus campinensis]